MSFVVTIRILGTLLPAIAIIMTLFRLYYRTIRRHLGWDDAWAGFAVICCVFMTTGAWVRSDSPQTGPFHQGQRVRILGYYMLQFSFTCVLWSSRMSILFSTIRLIPHMMRLRIWALSSAAFFGAMWIALLVFKIVTCETKNAWKKLPNVQCVLGPAVGSTEIATDFIADFILVFLPIKLLWNISLSPTRRTVLTGIFSASMLITIISIIHCVFVFSHNRNAEGIMAHVQASTALMVCNLAVLVTWCMRALGHQEDPSSLSERTPANNSGSSRRPNFTSLRFHHVSGPIVLHSLDKTKRDTNSIASNGSNESVHGATSSAKRAKTDPEV